MVMERTRIVRIAVVGALAVGALAGGVALASHEHHEFAKRGILRHVDAVLDAVQATSPQRDAVHAATDQLFLTLAENHKSERNDFAQALKLWEADQIDQAKLAQLRADHQAAAQRAGDAIAQAILDARDALTPEQRQKAAEFARTQRPPMKAEHAAFIKQRIAEHVADLLDEIKATPAQRERVQAAVGEVEAAFASQMGDHGAHLERVLTLFAAPTLNPGDVQKLKDEQQARMRKLGDSIVQALTEVHDVLDAGQRQKIADFVRAHHSHHGG
jgi:Spy/CpxP family protein refolding chaperone